MDQILIIYPLSTRRRLSGGSSCGSDNGMDMDIRIFAGVAISKSCFPSLNTASPHFLFHPQPWESS